MPPPRRRRPVQPATHVRLPRAARARSGPANGVVEAEPDETVIDETVIDEGTLDEAGMPGTVAGEPAAAEASGAPEADEAEDQDESPADEDQDDGEATAD